MCGTLPETLTLFQTKICDFPYPISDLILKSIRVTSCYGTYMVGVNIQRLECTNHTLFQTKLVIIDTLFQATKTAKKPYRLAPHLPI